MRAIDAVVVHDLADDAGGRRGRRGARDRPSLRSARCARARRRACARSGKTWPGVTRSSGRASGSTADADRVRAVGGADAGGDAVARLDADTVNAVPSGGPPRLARRLHRQLERVDLLLGEREADEAAAVLGHEVDRLGRDHLGGHRQIALVLAVLVVDEDDHLAGADVVERIDDARDPLFGSHLLYPSTSFSTYLPIKSTSRFTRGARALLRQRRRRLRVRDERHRELSASTALTVRLMPSTAIEPFSMT